jgi:phage shock protein A
VARRAPENAPTESDLKLGRQFRDARDRCASTAEVAAAHRLTRIRWRESILEAALEKGELKLANDILDSIAKEAGEVGKEPHGKAPDEAARARERVFRSLDALRQRFARRDHGDAPAPRAGSAAQGA